MDTQEYLAAIRAKLGITSTYAIAKALGVTKESAGRWNHGLGGFSEEVCIRVAKILEIHPGKVMIDMQRERAQTDSTRAIWLEILDAHERAQTEEARAEWHEPQEKFSKSFNYPVLRASPRPALRLAR